MLGNGDATFTQAMPIAQDSGGLSWVVVTGDVDGDGDVDAAVANSVSGNGAILRGNGDGTLARPFGKVGRELTVQQGTHAARLTALAILGSLQRELGDLDRIVAWTRVFGMVNSAVGFNQQPTVINGFSDLIIELFGQECGAHARCAVGMAELPFDLPVEIEAEVAIAT